MRKLLRADFCRLFRDRIFLLSALFMALAGVLIPLAHHIENVKKDGCWSPDASFFTYVFLAAVLSSLFCPFFVGREYSDGTLRNKLIAGHRRAFIYLSNLTVCTAAGWLLCVSYMIPHTVLGFFLLGPAESSPGTLLLYTVLSFSLTAAFSALFTLIAMLCKSKAYAAVGCILLSFALLFAGVRIVSALNEPEYYDAYSYTENDVTVSEEESKNPNYLSGTKRRVYRFLYDFVPGGQAIQLTNLKAEKPGYLALYNGWILLLSAGAGVAVFRKKDLK